MFNQEIHQYLKNKRVLFVDDDKNITNMFIGIFKNSLGIQADCAYDGQEGLDLFHKYNHNIIITDIKMPVLNGYKMVDAILNINPEVKIIFLSGYHHKYHNFTMQHNTINPSIVYIDKPISTYKFQMAFDKLFNITTKDT